MSYTARVLWLRLPVLALGLLVGWGLGRWLAAHTGSGATAITNTASLMIAGLLLAFLLAPRAERGLGLLWERLARWYVRLAPRRVAAATVGAVVALLVGVLASNLLAGTPFYTWWVGLIITLVLMAFFVGFALRNAEALGILALSGPTRRKSGGKLLDTNIIIDGRIVELVRAGFLDGELTVPTFVLRELQFLADHADPQRRASGKRGLAVLEDLRELGSLRIDDWDAPELRAVDDKLVRLARESGARLVTNDANLSKIARIQGVPVASVQEAAVALRPRLQVGDLLTVTVSRAGQQAGQGVAYLDDGTMIVVEDGVKHKGKPVRVQVMNNVQTNVGRMVFARVDESA